VADIFRRDGNDCGIARNRLLLAADMTPQCLSELSEPPAAADPL
jgi:hypothetical protein